MSQRVAIAGVVFLVGVVSIASAPRDVVRTRFESYRETLVVGKNKTSFDMIAVDGGDFLMGSPVAEEGRNRDEGPQVKVRIRPFWIGKCEVSWDEFDAYYRLRLRTDSDASTEKKAQPADAVTRPTQPYVDETYGHQRDKHPAICMTHHTAMLYCEWLTKTTGKNYRLPTEAEWEFACRAGSTKAHSIPDGGNLHDYAWYAANSWDQAHPKGTTHPVGAKKPNAWGIHDMHGNVMEWCMDHYVSDAYVRFGKLPLIDGHLLRPLFKPSNNKWSHVARGGHFKSDANGLRSAARTGSNVNWMRHDPQAPQSIFWLTNMDTIGFRVARSLEADELDGVVSRVPKANDETFRPK